MLTYSELLGQVRQLSPAERLALIEATTQMLKEDLHIQAALSSAVADDVVPGSSPQPSAGNTDGENGTSKSSFTPFIREEWLQLDEAALKAQGLELRGTPVDNVLGTGWPVENGLLPTDLENKEEYINYLVEKYS